MRILIVEDERYMAEAIQQVLRKQYSVDLAFDGEHGLDCALSNTYDAIILDVMLPKRNGFEIVREMRAQSIMTPVLLLTARDALDDKVHGLDSGADDYLSKPFQMDELKARMRALIRRQPGFKDSKIYTYLDISLDVSQLKLTCQTQMLPLTLKESQVLEILLLNKSQIISKATMIERIWGFEEEVEDNHVEVYISFLRKKLIVLDSIVMIKTVRGLGYVLDGR